MKFKVKVLASILLLSAASSAFAATSNVTAVGGSELLLTLFNPVTQKSAAFDLGISQGSFNTTLSGQTFNLKDTDRSAAWNSFMGQGSQSDVLWGVIAGNNRGTAGQQSFITTGASTWTDITNGDVISINDKVGSYILDLNNNATFNSATNGGAYITSTSVTAYAGNTYNEWGQISELGADMLGALGTNLNVWNVNNQASNGISYLASNASMVANGVNAAYFSLDAVTGTLTYTAPVPEEGTAAMILSGVCLMGFIARRRKNV